jgi:hypothetical protein
MDYCAYTRWRNARWLRRAWYRDLVETQIQRDVRDVTRVHSFHALPSFRKATWRSVEPGDWQREREREREREEAIEFFASQAQGKPPTAHLFATAKGTPWRRDEWAEAVRAAISDGSDLGRTFVRVGMTSAFAGGRADIAIKSFPAHYQPSPGTLVSHSRDELQPRVRCDFLRVVPFENSKSPL